MKQLTLFSEREMKLWRLALDPGAKKGEIENAMVMIGNSLRSRNFKTEQLGFPSVPKVEDWGATIMPLKKHKGKTIREIAMTDPSYLSWCLHWVKDGDEELQHKFKFLIVAINNFYREGR